MLIDSAVENISVLGPAKIVSKNILISPDGSKIAYSDSGSVGIFWLTDTNKQPLKKTGDQELIYQSLGNISHIYWHNSNEYLIFLENKNLKTVELYTRDKTNIASWSEPILAMDYLAQDSKLYILENSAVKVMEDKF